MPDHATEDDQTRRRVVLHALVRDLVDALDRPDPDVDQATLIAFVIQEELDG